MTGADGVGGARDALGMAGEGRAGEQPEQAGRRDGSVGEVAQHGRGKQGEVEGFAAGKAEFDGDGAFADGGIAVNVAHVVHMQHSGGEQAAAGCG